MNFYAMNEDEALRLRVIRAGFVYNLTSMRGTPSSLHPLLRKAQFDAYTSVIDEIDEALALYETSKSKA